MAARPIRYELHVRPLMRLIDRDNMAWAFDLWDYDQVRAHADDILQRIQVDMPPNPYGGPWPPEWVAVFQRWKDEGFLRLDLGTVDATGYKATRVGTTITLTGRGSTPTSGYRAWLDAVVPEGQLREYVLYWEPPVPAQQPPPALFRAKATFQAPATLTEVAVVDATGRRTVPIVGTPPPVALRATLNEVHPVLEAAGASHVQTVPMIGGQVACYRIGSTDLEVFCHEHGLDVEAPGALPDPLKKALDSVKRPKNKP